MTNRPNPCAKAQVGSSTVSSSSTASSVSASGSSTSPTGTGCAYLGDRSLDPLAGESVSDSCLGVCWGVFSLRNISPWRDFNTQLQFNGTTGICSRRPGRVGHTGVAVILISLLYTPTTRRGLSSSPCSRGQYPQPLFTPTDAKRCCSMAATRAGTD